MRSRGQVLKRHRLVRISRPACGVHPYATARASDELANGEDDVLSRYES